MEMDPLSAGSLPIDQLERYAKDLSELYRSEKEKTKELEAAYQKLQETKDLLVQSEKLAAIGRLATGVAHEILNPVNIISLRLQFLGMTEELSAPAKNSLAICKDQLNRIVEITKDLGRLSGTHKKHITMGDLNEVIGHVLTLAAPQFKEKDITTDVQYHPDLPLIALDRERIEQVIFNITSNAAAAMADQETRILRIITKPAPSKDCVQVIISDTGTGIDQSDIYRIFDPFFTAKGSDLGAGLGFFISYSIVKDHGGRIWAENNEWGGASFFIDLPLVRDTNNQCS
ncbi:MAG: hypothetical protein JRJ77_10925 [Deltaproteobacteria bacterium]|nr:hypothetical protein [Deltaproteobacteria bacterium]